MNTQGSRQRIPPYHAPPSSEAGIDKSVHLPEGATYSVQWNVTIGGIDKVRASNKSLHRTKLLACAPNFACELHHYVTYE